METRHNASWWNLPLNGPVSKRAGRHQFRHMESRRDTATHSAGMDKLPTSSSYTFQNTGVSMHLSASFSCGGFIMFRIVKWLLMTAENRWRNPPMSSFQGQGSAICRYCSQQAVQLHMVKHSRPGVTNLIGTQNHLVGSKS